MPAHPLSRELAQESVDAYRAAGDNQTRAADALGISRATFQNRLRAAARYGLMGPVKAREGFSIVQITERPPRRTRRSFGAVPRVRERAARNH